ncbi:MAG: sigma-54-dependent Fis family transcriptional regulator [Nitrospirae bacterium]|nr:MAG: sigma-54-dependent Fis family transcriptional regulator [Nitrospirota bacterium]
MHSDRDSRRSVLLVDDDEHLRAAIREALEHRGYCVRVARDGHEGLQYLMEEPVQLVLIDLNMPGMNGIEMLRTLRSAGFTVPVVVLTAYGTMDSAIEAMKLGATDYLRKPCPLEEVERLVQRFCMASPEPVEATEHELRHPQDSDGFLTRNDRMRHLLAMLEPVAKSQATILIQGESGTGKEVLARYIHRRSNRADQPFVAVNCAALPEGLLESELFGYEKGAFTGAIHRRCGKFELAHRGTLLLDEIGEMSLALQAKLLRVLQEREVDRLGSHRPVAVDIRVIATTNRSLIQEVQAGRFREDVYYRLSVVPITLPPLRERPEDIEVLAEHFVKQSCARNGRPMVKLTKEAVAYLTSRPWRGNVRELENVIERGVLLAQSGSLRPEHLTFETVAVTSAPDMTFSGTVWEMERQLILKTLDRLGGNRTHAARALGISIRTLRNKLREYRQRAGGDAVGF